MPSRLATLSRELCSYSSPGNIGLQDEPNCSLIRFRVSGSGFRGFGFRVLGVGVAVNQIPAGYKAPLRRSQTLAAGFPGRQRENPDVRELLTC